MPYKGQYYAHGPKTTLKLWVHDPAILIYFSSMVLLRIPTAVQKMTGVEPIAQNNVLKK